MAQFTADSAKTYVIGDLQGCAHEAELLVERIDKVAPGAHIVFVGDLINRGPDSLAALRLAHRLAQEGRATALLGNHDLHLLAVAAGGQPPSKSDTLDAILAAPDLFNLLTWLRQCPLALQRDGALIVHAGVPPQWDAAQTLALAGEVESVLRGAAWIAFLSTMYGNEPAQWDHGLQGMPRLRFIVNALTRLRFCDTHGTMDFKLKESGVAPAGSGLMPWFDVPGRRSAASTVVFGHWSALGLLMRPGLIGVDSGCVWGGKLTAVCLQDHSLLQVDCPEYRAIKGI
jgi:bis(5'-nucleosyl)-tetraphosphatase (symmetrical)